MKIKTLNTSDFGKEVMFGEEILKFDRLGFTEVKKELAEKLLETYNEQLVPESAVLDSEETSIYKKELVEKTIGDLKKENEKLTKLLEEKDATIKVTEEDNKEWKSQVDLLKDKADKAVEELEGYKIQKEKEVSELKLKIDLLGKSSAELSQYCEALKIPKEKFSSLKKDDMIQLILDESRQ